MTKRKEYRIALRPMGENSAGIPVDSLDDVVVNDVRMFRAEMMDKGALWMCCYLDGFDAPVTFWVRARKSRLEFQVTDSPAPSKLVTYEPGSLR